MSDDENGPELRSLEDLRARTVGEPQPLAGPIVLHEYDSAWPSMYAQEAERVRGILGARVLLLEHVGSTSVEGLAAKPIIDMVLAVADSSDEAAYVPGMEAGGYLLRVREPDWFEHRLFKAPPRSVNLHVFSAGCSEIDQMLRFRDWLRAHPDDREQYASAKRDLARRTWRFTQHYADAKTEVVRAILARANAAGTA